MTGYVMFRKDLGKRGRGVIFILKNPPKAYEIKLEKEQNVKKLSGVNSYRKKINCWVSVSESKQKQGRK
ncbi:hypothetical protein NP493_545g01104 [Ridgeia piscesae]|uniref:Uncharacterized protein n=1 Tax=Ridgeia piscesae TaxID=27915 RepID=A0AAD9KVQ6_RIDPI|nr:hypothetical protein NP493_545g01104 [Ridgeia piscesae]